jgi:hypothetical protein
MILTEHENIVGFNCVECHSNEYNTAMYSFDSEQHGYNSGNLCLDCANKIGDEILAAGSEKASREWTNPNG